MCAVLSHSVISISVRPHGCSPLGSAVHGDSQGKHTGVVCHALLQGIFPTQELNPGLCHCKWILYPLSHQGSPNYMSIIVKEVMVNFQRLYVCGYNILNKKLYEIYKMLSILSLSSYG